MQKLNEKVGALEIERKNLLFKITRAKQSM